MIAFKDTKRQCCQRFSLEQFFGNATPSMQEEDFWSPPHRTLVEIALSKLEIVLSKLDASTGCKPEKNNSEYVISPAPQI